MKICAKCGTRNEDADMFCKGCGSALDQPDAASGNGQNSLTAVLKEKGSSGLFLAALIFFTLGIVLNIVSAFDTSSLKATMVSVFSSMDMDAMNQAISMVPYTTIIGSIPLIFMCIGLWMIRGTCSGGNDKPLSTAGFSLVKGFTILQLVLTCILMAVVLLMTVIAIFIVMGGYEIADLGVTDIRRHIGNGAIDLDTISTMFAVFAAIFLLIVLIAAVLSIVYYAKVIGSLNRAKEIAITGSTTKNVSMFVAVINIIGGVCGLLTFIMGIANLLSNGGSFSVLSVLISLVQPVTNLLFGGLIISVHGAISRHLS